MPGPLAAWGLPILVALGCAASSAKDADHAGGDDGLTRRDTAVEHEPCDLSDPGAERIDANGDGATDVTIVRAGETEICRALDLNFDGVVDAWVYRDTGGQVRRRENDYDRDGRIDEIAIFKGGVISEKHRATTLGGQLDTWHYFRGGHLARTERDSNGDAVVDQWWDYPHVDKPECPLIHADLDGDGKPDPGASVDVCEEQAGYVAPIETGGRKAFDFDGPAGDVPTEVEEEPSSGEAGGGTPEGASGASGDGKAPAKEPSK